MRKFLGSVIIIVTITLLSCIQIGAKDNITVDSNFVNLETIKNQLQVGQLQKVEFNLFSRDVWFEFCPSNTGSYMIHTYGGLFLQAELYNSAKDIKLDCSNKKDSNISFARTFIQGQKYYIHITVDSEVALFGSYYILTKYIDNPDDELFSQQWGLLNEESGLDINILPAWESIRKEQLKEVYIGIADTGVYLQHVDLENRLNKDLSYNFVHNSTVLYPEAEKYSTLAAKGGHGTAVTGIIGAETGNKIGISGICSNSSLIHMKVLGKRIQNVPYSGSVAAFVQAVEYAQENNIKVINCSFGGASPSVTELDAMEKAGDILFVIAAGNKGNNLDEIPEYPACYYLKNSLVVSSVNRKGEISSFSNYGGPCAIAAPGENILSTYPEDIFDTSSGTSMSAPFVTGVAGLIYSEYPYFSPEQVIKSIVSQDSVTYLEQLKGKVSSRGVLNAYKAIKFAKKQNISNIIDRMKKIFIFDSKEKIMEYLRFAKESSKTNQIILKIAGNKKIEDIVTESKSDLKVLAYLESVDAYVLECNNIEECEAAIERFNNCNNVSYAEMNYIRSE